MGTQVFTGHDVFVQTLELMGTLGGCKAPQ
jgi:hypothetical protein